MPSESDAPSFGKGAARDLCKVESQAERCLCDAEICLHEEEHVIDAGANGPCSGQCIEVPVRNPLQIGVVPFGHTGGDFRRQSDSRGRHAERGHDTPHESGILGVRLQC